LFLKAATDGDLSLKPKDPLSDNKSNIKWLKFSQLFSRNYGVKTKVPLLTKGQIYANVLMISGRMAGERKNITARR